MDFIWTTYYSPVDLPERCCREAPEPAPFSGQIGGFPACGEPSAYVVQFERAFIRELDLAAGGCEAVVCYTGLCVRHTAELSEHLPEKYIVNITEITQL